MAKKSKTNKATLATESFDIVLENPLGDQVRVHAYTGGAVRVSERAYEGDGWERTGFIDARAVPALVDSMQTRGWVVVRSGQPT